MVADGQFVPGGERREELEFEEELELELDVLL